MAAIFNLHGLTAQVIDSIEIKRQFKPLDILTIVNDTYAILIEDKTFSKNHSDQLNRYRKSVESEYPHLIQLPIYSILLESDKHGLNLHKPARTRVGKVMTIAQRLDYIQLNSDGTVDSKRTIDLLKRY
ncbi:PD-(D/E)XK nuclease family protein [Cytobacillus firmus]|uniref:PD-(D/E)XK nuclease family protein n=1 Tax=Cytobacillus firmus TaxID=1399 RepID=UPI0018CCAA00|nr:PD-(D/E)XK nuclease family protein [Cytobacillus firmus]MED1905618.1 PD-(D/E)XK nuclease family protein [Cytobacillus firmus]